MLSKYSDIAKSYCEEYMLSGRSAAHADLVKILSAVAQQAVTSFVRGEDRHCLICGDSQPCMDPRDLKSGDPGIPCTFDMTPMDLFQWCGNQRRKIQQLETENTVLRNRNRMLEGELYDES